MEVVAVGFDRLVAPLLSRSEEPGEGEDDPPDGGGHAKVVEDEEDDGAACGLQPLLDDVELAMLTVAGDVLSSRHRADDEGHGVDVVAHGEEDDGALWVLEAVRLQEEGQNSERGGDEAEDGPHRHPDEGKVLVLSGPEDVYSRGAARRTRLALLHELELVRVLAGAHAAWQAGAAGARLPGARGHREHALALLALRPGFVLGGLHAQGVGVVPGGQLGAVQRVGPGVAELLHDGGAPLPGLLAHGSAGGDGGRHLVRAHGGVEGAEEEAEVHVAAVGHQGGELVQLDGSLLLVVVVHEVGHAGQVVADPLAHGDHDGLALGRSAALQVVGADLEAGAWNHQQAPEENHHLQRATIHAHRLFVFSANRALSLQTPTWNKRKVTITGSLPQTDPRYIPMAEAGPSVAFTASKTLQKDPAPHALARRGITECGAETINPTGRREEGPRAKRDTRKLRQNNGVKSQIGRGEPRV